MHRAASGQQITVDVNQLQTVVCGCSKFVFRKTSIFKIVPTIYSNTGKPSLFELNCIECTSCGAVYTLDDVMKSISGDMSLVSTSKNN